MAEQHKNVIFIKVDVDNHKDIAAQASIRAMPTFALFKNGNKITQFEGANVGQLQTLVTEYDTLRPVYYENAKRLIDSKAAFTQSEDAMKTLISVLSNIVNHPTEEKYRSLKTTNPAIEKRLGSVSGSYQFLEGIGFEKHGEIYVLSLDKDVTEEFGDILELLKKQQSLAVQMAKIHQQEELEKERKKKVLAERQEKLKEERRLQAEQKKLLNAQVKEDHRK